MNLGKSSSVYEFAEDQERQTNKKIKKAVGDNKSVMRIVINNEYYEYRDTWIYYSDVGLEFFCKYRWHIDVRACDEGGGIGDSR